MGWKNVKTHYRIEHIVHVRDGRVCIGSGYVSEIIVIKDGVPRCDYGLGPAKGDLARVFAEMTEDPATLRRLIAEPDTMKASIPVYTYDMTGGAIVELRCEVPGWPNVTHDGQLMYENTFSTDRAEVVGWAISNARAGIESMRRSIAHMEGKLAEHRRLLVEYETALDRFSE